MTNLASYQNGNAAVNLFSNGTRVINYEGKLSLDFPLNIDIRVSTKCSFGFNPATQKSICSFCHESARTDGIECNYNELLQVLSPLPKGVELAIGSNQLTPNLMNFLKECSLKGWVCNLTINQGHTQRDFHSILYALDYKLIYGLGISYRSGMKAIPKEILSHPNTVVHVIAGIDNFSEVLALSSSGAKKILVLGEKDFGFNKGKVNLNSQSHKEWQWYVCKLFDTFKVVSFDNLAIEQLEISRFLPESQWDEFYQGEHSMYINAVDKAFSPSSRSSEKESWATGIKEYFKKIEKN